MCLCASFLTKGQDARELYNNQNFQEAALAFERAFFENGDPENLLYKAYSYKKLLDYEKAIRALQRINTYDTLLEQRALYELALLQHLNGQYAASYNTLLRYKLYGYPFSQNLAIIECINLIHTQKWDEARALMFMEQDLLDLTDEDIEKILPEGLEPKKKKKASTLSYLIPGTGQMYAGYFGKGLVSGGLNASAIAFTAYSAWTGYYFTGVLSGAALFYTVYLGGARHARQLVDKKNHRTVLEIEERFKNAMSNKVVK